MKLIRMMGAGIAALAISTVAAMAQTAENQVRAALNAGMAPHAERGYSAASGIADLNRPMQLNSAFLWQVNLRRGVNYRVYGVCDNDCSDLDMEVYGADGVLVEKDDATDATPFVQITPTQTGRHYVRIWLFNCSAEPCSVGARVVQGGTPEERAPSGGGESYASVVSGELDAAGAAHLAAGYTPFGADILEAVTIASEGHRATMRLEAGKAYLFQGACDQDCSDVDLEVLNAAGESVARDVEVDDRPVVGLEPTANGDYTVRIWLAQCAVEPCFVGVRSYSRNK